MGRPKGSLNIVRRPASIEAPAPVLCQWPPCPQGCRDEYGKPAIAIYRCRAGHPYCPKCLDTGEFLLTNSYCPACLHARYGRAAQRGQALVEYALIILLVALVVILAVAAFGGQIGTFFSGLTAGL